MFEHVTNMFLETEISLQLWKNSFEFQNMIPGWPE